MDRKVSGETIVDKGWGIISQNTELLIFIAVGIIATLAEAAGYTSFIRLNDLLPPLPELGNISDYGDIYNQTNETDLVHLTEFTIIHKISEVVDTVGKYTVYISLVAYMLLPYPVITEKKKVLLVPWLIMSVLKLVLWEMVITLVGIVLCASRDIFFFPCVQYSALQGTQFCFNVYFWTSVHSFYHYLDKTHSNQENDGVINTINRVGNLPGTLSPQLSKVFSLEMAEDDDYTEATLVERAAMAWIAREILENDEEQVTDQQFSQYLVIKATMELKQALKELGKRKTLRKSGSSNLSPKDMIKQSLELKQFPNYMSKSASRTKDFYENKDFSTMDSIRIIPPLPVHFKPAQAVDTTSMLSEISNLTEETVCSTGSADMETQTEPSTQKMSRVLDILDYQQQQRRNSKMEGSQNRMSF